MWPLSGIMSNEYCRPRSAVHAHNPKADVDLEENAIRIDN